MWIMLWIIYCSFGLVFIVNFNYSVGKGGFCGLFFMNSFNLKDMVLGLGSEVWLDCSKGDVWSDIVLFDFLVIFIINEDNEEIEGSDVFVDYLLGDVEGEEDELYLLDLEYVYFEEFECVLL